MNHLETISKSVTSSLGNFISMMDLQERLFPITGVITEIYTSKMSSRRVWFAKVFEAVTGQFYNMSLMTLSLLKD